VLALWIAVPPVVAEDAEEPAAEDTSAAEAEAEAKETPRPKPQRRGRLSAKEKAAAKAEGPRRDLRPREAKILIEAKEHLSEERYDEAEAVLGKLRLKSLKPYELALTHRIYAYIAYGREDGEKALEHMQASLDVPDGLPKEDRADVLFQVAQLHGAKQRWKQVIASLESWFQTVEKPNSLGYYLLAMSHYQLEQYEAALPPAKKAVEIAENPQQSWLQLLLAIYLTNKQYVEATPVLIDLISRYPNSGKNYWLQLSSLYGVQEKNDRALIVLELANRRGLLTEDRDLRRLAQMLLYNEIPIRAAQVIEKGIEDKRLKEDAEVFEMLSNSFILAREVRRAEAPLARAAELSNNGKLYVRLAQVRLLQENWNDAATALRQALEKGGLEDTQGSVQLLLGITYYNKNELQEARNWFARAQNFGATRKQAEGWLEHVNREIEAKNTGLQAG
jgi:tetratricopeptide (TPR) repeat protein